MYEQTDAIGSEWAVWHGRRSENSDVTVQKTEGLDAEVDLELADKAAHVSPHLDNRRTMKNISCYLHRFEPMDQGCDSSILLLTV